MEGFLPMNLEEGKRHYRDFSGFDVVFITGDPYYDHPLSGAAVLARLLDSKGYKVGIIAQPVTDADYLACGKPRVACITSGLLDSMLANYTPMLKKRDGVLVPERALMVYTQKAKQLLGSITVLGGVEATIRRFTHFDYRMNELRRGILHDTKADILLFGNAERSLLGLLERLKGKESKFADIKESLNLASLDGAAYRVKKDDGGKARVLPSFEDCATNPEKFNLLTRMHYLLPDDSFLEGCGLGFIKHNRPSHPLNEEEMDTIYGFPFTRKLHPDTRNIAFVEKMVDGLQASVILGRGCWGSCNFCIIPLVQGKNVSQRSAKGIVREIEALYDRGVRKINDLTMPTINMYGSRCDLYDEAEEIYSPVIGKSITVFNKTKGCNQQCVGCPHRVITENLIPLLKEIEKLNHKHHASLEIRSAIRHDIILEQKALFRKIMEFTTRLKIAPEHITDSVLKQMNKADGEAFVAFLKEYKAVNREQGTHKNLVPYFVVAHPGCSKKEMDELVAFSKKHGLFTNLTQVFTPTPGTASTAMYYTGVNPLTQQKVFVPRNFREKKDQKNMLVVPDEFIDGNG